MYKMSFVDALVAGAASFDDFEDYVEYWHTNPLSIELNEFLGMSDNEFGQMLVSGAADAFLQSIVDSRRCVPLPVAV